MVRRYLAVSGSCYCFWYLTSEFLKTLEFLILAAETHLFIYVAYLCVSPSISFTSNFRPPFLAKSLVERYVFTTFRMLISENQMVESKII